MSLKVAVPIIVSVPQINWVEVFMVHFSALEMSVVPRARFPGVR